MAYKVPRGIAAPGSFKSPLMFAPATMPVYNFKTIQPVPSAKVRRAPALSRLRPLSQRRCVQDFVDVVLSRTQRKTPTVIHPGYAINRIRAFYMRKVKFTQQTWHDAQALCQSLGSNLITIDSAPELAHLGRTVHFTKVASSWGLDWQCVWAGFHDQAKEGQFEWVSKARPGYTPAFGPFEAANGDGSGARPPSLLQSTVVPAARASDRPRHDEGSER